MLRRGSDWAIGPEVEEFEKDVASYVGRRHAVSFNSGTSALHAAMIALGVGIGDRVVVPSFTFIATANAALFVGATPRFADIEPRTFGLDAVATEKVLRQKTKALVPVHIGGVVCEQAGELEELARRRRVLLIEDACEALGSTAKGREAGTYGDVSILSFCANKVISTGEGGMVLTDDSRIHERLTLVKSHGRLDKQNYFRTTSPPDYVRLGYNWRISSMTAALGVSQLGKLERAVDGRRKVAASISRGLRRIPGLEIPHEPEGFRHTYQMYTVKVKGGKRVRDGLRGHLSKQGVFSKVYFDPIHLSRFYRGRPESREAELPVTEMVGNEVLTLPVYPTMTKEEVAHLTGSVAEFFRA